MAFQEMIRQRVNLNKLATLYAVNKVALIAVKEDDFINEQQWAAITHLAMIQYSFKKALGLYPG